MMTMVCQWLLKAVAAETKEKTENESGNAKNMRRVMKVISFTLIGLKTISLSLILLHFEMILNKLSVAYLKFLLTPSPSISYVISFNKLSVLIPS